MALKRRFQPIVSHVEGIAEFNYANGKKRKVVLKPAYIVTMGCGHAVPLPFTGRIGKFLKTAKIMHCRDCEYVRHSKRTQKEH